MSDILPETRSIRAVKIFIFAVAVGLFLVCVTVFKIWGRDWTLAVYRPLLLERVTAACKAREYDKAEAILIKALDASPEYARDIEKAVAPDLGMMPKASAKLREILGGSVPDAGRQDSRPSPSPSSAPTAQPSKTARPER